MADDKTLGQQYYETVEDLKKGGMSNADAIRKVAEQFGKEVNAIRGGIHQYKRTHLEGGGTTTRRSRGRAAASVDDYIATARKALQDALALVDREVTDAKAALDSAQARYDEAVAGVKDKKAEIEKKLKAIG